MMKNIDLIANILNQCLDNTGRIINEKFRTDLKQQLKSDLSPVSLLDKLIELEIKKFMLLQLNEIKHNFPAINEFGFYGEEFGSQNKESRFIWHIDPIDGTKSLVSGFPIFCTLLALYDLTKPVIGAIDSPITHERWVAYANKCWFNQKIVTTSSITKIDQAQLATTSPYMFSTATFNQFNQIAKQVKICRFGGDAYNYGLLASGFIDLVIEDNLKIHDVAALIPVIENAGGVITDWAGCKIDLRTQRSNVKIIAAANQKLYERAMLLLNSNST